MKKSRIFTLVKPSATYFDFVNFYNVLWTNLIEQGYSFIIKDKNNQMVGVSLNYDLNGKPRPTPDVEAVQIIYTYIDFIEEPIR